MLSAVRGSNVVVTNPTHIAIALQYEHGVDDLPVVVAKGEDGIAALIRKTAEEAGVPILQNVQLARGLNEKVELDNYIGSEFFDAVAEVLHWADGMRRETGGGEGRSEEHTSELQSLMRHSYAVFCLKKKNRHNTLKNHTATN